MTCSETCHSALYVQHAVDECRPLLVGLVRGVFGFATSAILERTNATAAAAVWTLGTGFSVFSGDVFREGAVDRDGPLDFDKHGRRVCATNERHTTAVWVVPFVALCVHAAAPQLAGQARRIRPDASSRAQFEDQPRIAVVVGVGAYPESSEPPPLKYSARDAKVVADELTKRL